LLYEQQSLTTISATGTPPPNIQVFPLSEWVPRSCKETEAGAGVKSQCADCSAAIRDSRGGWLLNSSIIPLPVIPLAAISFGN
jgi:hypothetical protein